MTLVFGSLRIEVYLCERHFDALSDWFASTDDKGSSTVNRQSPQ